MGEMIIELLTRGGVHAGYHRIETFPVKIGRALDNDLIIPDPYVSPLHAIIDRNENGNWMVRDMESTNGTLLGKEVKITGSAEIVTGSQLIIGKTILRIMAPQHAVAPTQKLPPKQSKLERTLVPLISLCMVGFTLGFLTLIQYMNVSKETKFISLFASALPWIFFPLIWAGVWALAGFFLRHSGRFSLQLLITNAGLVGIFLVTALSEYVDYFTGSVPVGETTQYVAMFLLFMLVLLFNLWIASGAIDLKRGATVVLIAGCIVATIALTEHSDNLEKNITPKYSQTLKPPYIKPMRTVSPDQFLAGCEKMLGEKE